jgi:hypothetical protein
MMSLTERQRRAWNRIGDVLIPGGEGLPSFSASGVVDHVATALESSPPEDREALLKLVTLLAWLPRPLLALLMAANTPLRRVPGRVGAPFRLLDMGLRGVVFTVYYAGVDEGGRIHDGIDCHIHCEPLAREDN